MAESQTRGNKSRIGGGGGGVGLGDTPQTLPTRYAPPCGLPTASFEVEELSRLVMAGELRLVKQFFYSSTLGIVNEKVPCCSFVTNFNLFRDLANFFTIGVFWSRTPHSFYFFVVLGVFFYRRFTFFLLFFFFLQSRPLSVTVAKARAILPPNRPAGLRGIDAAAPCSAGPGFVVGWSSPRADRAKGRLPSFYPSCCGFRSA